MGYDEDTSIGCIEGNAGTIAVVIIFIALMTIFIPLCLGCFPECYDFEPYGSIGSYIAAAATLGSVVLVYANFSAQTRYNARQVFQNAFEQYVKTLQNSIEYNTSHSESIKNKITTAIKEFNDISEGKGITGLSNINTEIGNDSAIDICYSLFVGCLELIDNDKYLSYSSKCSYCSILVTLLTSPYSDTVICRIASEDGERIEPTRLKRMVTKYNVFRNYASDFWHVEIWTKDFFGYK